MLSSSRIYERHPMSHLSVSEAIQQQQRLIETNENVVEELDAFYQAMLKEFDPTEQKRRYLQQLNRKISSLYRHEGVLICIRYQDGTLDSFDPLVAEQVAQAHQQAPYSNAEVAMILSPVFGERLTVESFSGAEPSYSDLKQGYLYTPADLEAGFTADAVSLDEHMCDWIQLYQRWLHDYLAFNLAQISHDHQTADRPVRSPLDRKLTSKAQIAV